MFVCWMKTLNSLKRRMGKPGKWNRTEWNGAATFDQLDILSTCYFDNLIFRKIAFFVLSTCHFCQLVIFVNLSICQLVNLSFCQLVNLSFCQLVNLSTCQFVNLSICQFVILSTCQFVNLSTCHFVNKLFCLLVVTKFHQQVIL